MTPDVRPMVAGNWKMNGLRSALDQIKAIADGLDGPLSQKVDAVLCPPATLLYVATALAEDSPLKIGAQDCHHHNSGAYTGDVSAEMIADLFATHVIVGHSERRKDHAESDELVLAKAQAALGVGLQAIICVGETQAERDAGQTLDVLARQIAGSVPEGASAGNTIIAYEPVWAIGTGLTPTAADIAVAHDFLRSRLHERVGSEAAQMRILYGGSVKPSNAREILGIAHVDGVLVGGASLKAEDFLAIYKTYEGLVDLADAA
ncbi:triose-phosphate isomerase [Xaviernesmea oryzae]|uniref:Triosephosphate isomerase n=1 Tax=Xaviernesmea oryzae TaxID=464029 RepID=A0A1Q9AX97_9HYPH|nr:triose-phosphate isomerase [Xaviernesmea oryzae]OLP60074.1 triose-phosphate isomerase [Xaviernesmea oryzae]SEK37640.1 triosephosphate isomerase [Xaviernesmea oryzae]